MQPLSLNERAHALIEQLELDLPMLGGAILRDPWHATIIDLGVQARGGLAAGLRLAEVCLAGLGTVSLVPGDRALWSGPSVAVHTDHPLAACMGSQYAGWQVSAGKYSAMGSGPMRAAFGREPLFERYPLRESPDVAVGVLETSTLPPAAVLVDLAAQCRVPPASLTILAARTASLAGTVQVVARTVETALHKLLEREFDLNHVASGFGTAPLPPIASDDLVAMGRTNDAVLYGGEVTLWVRGDDGDLGQMGPQLPSSASRDFGRPFAEIFERNGRDFYQIDPGLFSPAVITLVNLDTGRSHRFGELRADVLQQSFCS